jgi:uncharacterized zinc-type alcohol dehydrogenase-like protein
MCRYYHITPQFLFILGIDSPFAYSIVIGITTWSPFKHNKVKPTDRVGIIGVGGLGHLAVQFSVKFGCHTTGISTSANKKAEILGFGAQEFLDVSDAKQLVAAEKTFDFLISTIGSNGINWDMYLNLLRPGIVRSYSYKHAQTV